MEIKRTFIDGNAHRNIENSRESMDIKWKCLGVTWKWMEPNHKSIERLLGQPVWQNRWGNSSTLE